jgi:Flp pilus assembly protein CpaB
MQKRLLLASLAGTVLSAALGHFYLERLENEVQGGAKVALLVASEDIALGAGLTEKLVAVREVPEAYIDSRQIRASDAKKVIGARVSSALKANDAVLWSDLASGAGRTRVLSALVERGQRAVAIDLKAGDFDGLLRPGDRVDVLLTERSRDGAVGATSLLVQNLLVLAVGADLGKADDTTKRLPARAGAVTLSASVEAAQLITQARERGQLSLTLRNSDDIALTGAVR